MVNFVPYSGKFSRVLTRCFGGLSETTKIGTTKVAYLEGVVLFYADPQNLKREKFLNFTSAKIVTLKNFPLYGTFIS